MAVLVTILTSDLLSEWLPAASAQKCEMNPEYTDYAYLRLAPEIDPEMPALVKPHLFDVLDKTCTKTDGDTATYVCTEIKGSVAYDFVFQIHEPKRSDWALHAALDFNGESRSIKPEIGATGKNEIAMIFQPAPAPGENELTDLKVGLVLNLEYSTEVVKEELFRLPAVDWAQPLKFQLKLVETPVDDC